jgi:parallel beta-helix repeat protein
MVAVLSLTIGLLILVQASATDAAMLINCDAQALPPVLNGSYIFTGTCRGGQNLTLPYDGTTIDGQGVAVLEGREDDPTIPVISVRGRWVTIKNFRRIAGPGTGIWVSRGGYAYIEGNTIEDNGREAIHVMHLGGARIYGNTVRRNGGDGIVVEENAAARIGFSLTDDPAARGNIITENAMNGIRVTRSGDARIIGNVITDNGQHGISVSRNAHADIAGNTIDRNARDAVSATENSGINLGTGTQATYFDELNRTTELNGGVGVACSIGGYVSGNLGSLNGRDGKREIARGCLRNVDN